MISFKNDDAGYREWTKQNRDGYVLALSNKREGLIHSSTCTHLDFSMMSVNLTKKEKVCSTDSTELRVWAREQGIAVRSCPDC